MVVEHCYTPVTRSCFPGLNTDTEADGVGGTFCKVMFETDCRTVYQDESRVKRKKRKTIPQTVCKRVPKTLCGGSNCDFVEEPEHCHNKTTSQVRQRPEESCEIVPNKVCKPVNNLVPFLEPVSQCKLIPRETCSFGVLNKLGGTPLVTKWCYDSDNKVISDQLKRRGKLTFDEGDNDGSYQLENTAAVQHNLRFSQIDVEDKAITKGRLLQDLQSVKNVPSQDLVDRNIIDQGEITSLYFDDSNSALENSRLDNNFAVENFNSFQEMINHGFHQNIPTTFQAATETNANVKEANDIQTLSNIDISAARQTLANIAIGRTVNKEGETSSSSGLRVIFPDTKEDSASGNKKDNDRDTPADNDDTGPVIEKVSVKTNIQELTRQPLQWSGQGEGGGDHSGFLGQQDTTIASRLEQERTMETDKHSFHFNDEELQTETFKGRVYTVYIFIFQMVP